MVLKLKAYLKPADTDFYNELSNKIGQIVDVDCIDFHRQQITVLDVKNIGI